jgi:nicotinate-nucleotide pyrophosphorylase (carboxylating)
LALSPLDPAQYRDLVRRALEEDRAGVDVTTQAIVNPSQKARGRLIAKAPCTVAGLPLAIESFVQLDAEAATTIAFNDGDECPADATIAEVVGRAAALLSAERTALNLLQRMSGIATLARAFVRASGGAVTILDTRKTTPLLRGIEKYAVRMGGATNHRMSLHDGVLIKDNHIAIAGGITRAVRRIKESAVPLPIEVEVETLDQVDEALAAGADILLLDNMATATIAEAVRRSRGRAKTEVSGGVTLDRVAEIAGCQPDFVSIGALTHSAPAIDISFDIEPA